MRILSWLKAAHRDTQYEWHAYAILPFQTIRLKDGSTAHMPEIIMRRRLHDGLWEHRRMTDAERTEEYLRDAW
jgi:hypothetical protein